MALTIFVVEDNPADVYLIKEALRAHGLLFDLKWMPDGEQAIAEFTGMHSGTAPTPDLILLDLNLPRVDGKEVLSRIRQNPSLRNTLVAILTSSDSPSDRRDTHALGANCYIRKPPTLDEFLTIGGVIKELVSTGRSPLATAVYP